MENISTDSSSETNTGKADYSGFWEGMTYLAFFIFSCLFVMPTLHANDKKYNFDSAFATEGILFGFVGAFVGIIVYKLIKNQPSWVKLSIIIILFACVFFQLITHTERFTRSIG